MLLKQTKEEKAGQVAAAFEGKNVLVTGGFGFIGGHMARHLVDFGAHVTVLDIRTDPGIDALLNDPALNLRERVKIIQGDLGDAKLLREVIGAGRFHYIFNFAAYATVIEKAVENPYDTIQANTLGLVNVLEAVRGLKTRPSMIFHASTDKVYGEMNGEPYEEERTPLRGIGVYDGAKLAADVFARTYNEVFGLPTVVLRMCNIFGPADYNIGYRLVPRAMRNLFGQAQPTGPELYFDSMEHYRDYLYVDDCIRAILLLAYHPECRGQVFNLAAVKFASTPELLKAVVHNAYEIEKEMDATRAEAILNSGISVKVRAGSPSVLTIQKQRLNGEKIKRMTGFEPSVEFNEAIKRTIRAYRAYFVSKGKLQA